MPNMVYMLEPHQDKPVAVDAADEAHLIQLLHEGWKQVPPPPKTAAVDKGGK